MSGIANTIFPNTQQITAPNYVIAGNVGIGTTTPTQQLDVNGAVAVGGVTVVDIARNITGSTFSGSGASLTALNAGNVSTGTLAVLRGGTGVTTSTGTGSVVLSAAPTLTGIVTGGTFSGSGASLTALNAGNVSTGTLAVARGGTGVTSSTGTGSVVLSADPTFTGTVTAAVVKGTSSLQNTSGNEIIQLNKPDGWLRLGQAGTAAYANGIACYLGICCNGGQGINIGNWVPAAAGQLITSGNINCGGTISASGYGGISSANVTGALGYTPYNSTNPNGYIGNNNTAYYAASINFTGGAGYWFYTGNTPNQGYQAGICYQDFGANTGSGWYFRYTGTDRYQIRFDGGGAGQVSDIRLKENIKPITNALSRIQSINGVYFTWIDKTFQIADKLNIGFIAQEVEAQFPELVTVNYSGDRMVTYANMTPILVEAVKELNAKVETQIAALLQLNNDTAHQLNFTGQHRCVLTSPMANADIDALTGLIFISSGRYRSMLDNTVQDGIDAITVSESIPMVELATVANDKRAFGILASRESIQKQREEGDNRVWINSIGEGAMWISDMNGSLENGDYITTSSIPGYGMKQNSEYTIAKITADCDFLQTYIPKLSIKKKVNTTTKMVEEMVEKVISYDKTVVDFDEVEKIYIQKTITETRKEKVNVKKKAPLYDVNRNVIGEHEYNSMIEETTNEIVNDLDAYGNLQWGYILDQNERILTEPPYQMRYLGLNGEIITQEDYLIRKTNGENVYRAAFIGCTYHCG